MQIYTALSLGDEERLIDSLVKFNLYCLPRFFSTDNPRIFKLGQLSVKDQIIFSDDFRKDVLEYIKPTASDPSRFHVIPKKGNCIEWKRSFNAESSELHTPGRFYFKPDLEVSEENSLYLTKVYRFICRQIKKDSFKSAGHIPIYVGKYLALLISQGNGKLTYLNGKKVDF